MVFYRKIEQSLKEWKEQSQGKTALLIEGARRVGKSTVAEEFAKAEYDSYILLDFSIVKTRIKNLFRNHLDDLDTFFQLLQAETGVQLHRRRSLLIFDEIQRFPRAREAIKALVLDGRYDYLETGSLISIRENVEDILIPSEEKSVHMFPMDFEEFCIACNEQMMVEYIRELFEKKKPLEDGLHRKAMLLLKQYMIVGGMPQSVKAYLEEGKSFYAADEAKRGILNLYRNDMMKISRKYRARVLRYYDQIPAFLSRHEKKLIIGNVSGEEGKDTIADAFFWLADSMIANECYGCNDPNVGMALNENRTSLKCYMGDTGLLISHTFSKKEIDEGELYKKLLNDNLSINKGMFFENLVAQMLRANGHDLFFYAHYNAEKHRNDMEIDFMLSNGSKTNFKVMPIEVKSAKNYTTTSLNEFSSRFHGRVVQPCVIHPKNLKEENGILYLPIYMGCFL